MPLMEGYDCVSFNPANSSYITIPDQDHFSFPGNIFTIEFWVKFTSKVASGILGKRGTTVDWEYSVYTSATGDAIRFNGWTHGGSTVYFVSVPMNPPIVENTWLHFAWVANGTSSSVYCNGVYMASADKTTNNMSAGGASPLEIGRGGDASGTKYHNGQIRDVRMWNIVRTPQEIRDNMTATLTGSETGLVGYWPLTQAYDGTAIDYSSYGINGTLVNAQWDYSYGAFRLQYSPKVDCLYFNGQPTSGAYVQVPYNATHKLTTQMTLEAWVSMDNWVQPVELRGTIVSCTENGGYALSSLGDVLAFSVYANGNHRYAQVATSTITPGFHHLVGRFDGRYVLLLVDGVIVATTDIGSTYPITYSANSPLMFGAEPSFLTSTWVPTYFFKGYIQDVRIWNTVRTQQEIRDNRNVILKGNETGLIGYWRMDEGSGNTIKDYTSNAIHATNYGGGWGRSGRKYEQNKSGILKLRGYSDTPDCLLFGGTSQYVSIPDSSVLKGFTAFTVEANFKYSVLLTAIRIVNKAADNDGAGGFGIYISTPEGLPRATFITNNSSLVIRGSTVLQPNVDYHVAVTINSSGVTNLYLNGMLDATATLALPGSSTAPLYFGNSVLGDRQFTGRVWDVRMWSVVRDQTQIKANIGKNLKGNESGLVGYWKIDEGMGTTVADSTSNGNHGTINGGASWAYAYNAFRLSSDGVLKTRGLIDGPDCISFDGVDDYIYVGDYDHLSFTNNIFTIEFWVKFTDKTNCGVLGKRGGPWEYSVFSSATDLYFRSWMASGGSNVYATTIALTTINVNEWIHFAWVANGTSSNVYCNGISIGTSGKTVESMGNTSSPFEIGRGGDGGALRYHKGSLRDIRVWNVARNTADIQANMYKTLQGNESGLVGYWKLAEGDGTVAQDSTSNASHGTINNGAAWAYSYDSPFHLTSDGILKIR